MPCARRFIWCHLEYIYVPATSADSGEAPFPFTVHSVAHSVHQHSLSVVFLLGQDKTMLRTCKINNLPLNIKTYNQGTNLKCLLILERCLSSGEKEKENLTNGTQIYIYWIYIRINSAIIKNEIPPRFPNKAVVRSERKTKEFFLF